MNEYNERFGIAVAYIKYKGIAKSQGEIAQRCGILPSMLSMVLKGDRHPSIDLMRRLCENYPIDLMWLCTGDGEMIKK
jgi:transcriptional regulator with XRE-family HTH domain